MDYGGDWKSLAVKVRHRLEASRPSPAPAPQPRVLRFRWGRWTDGRTAGRTQHQEARALVPVATASVLLPCLRNGVRAVSFLDAPELVGEERERSGKEGEDQGRGKGAKNLTCF